MSVFDPAAGPAVADVLSMLALEMRTKAPHLAGKFVLERLLGAGYDAPAAARAVAVQLASNFGIAIRLEVALVDGVNKVTVL